MRIDHINIRAPGYIIGQVRDFYCSLFGMAVGPRPAFRQDGYWLCAGDEALVHLSIDEAVAASDDRGFLDHVAFQTSGLATFTARLMDLEIEFRTHYIPELDMTQLFFQDPAGTGLEVNFPGER